MCVVSWYWKANLIAHNWKFWSFAFNELLSSALEFSFSKYGLFRVASVVWSSIPITCVQHLMLQLCTSNTINIFISIISWTAFCFKSLFRSAFFSLNIASPARVSSPFGGVSVPKKRRFEAGDDDDESSDDLIGSMSNARYSFRVSTTAQSGLEFTSDQDGQGKWVKLINSSDEVSVFCVRFWQPSNIVSFDPHNLLYITIDHQDQTITKVAYLPTLLWYRQMLRWNGHWYIDTP